MSLLVVDNPSVYNTTDIPKYIWLGGQQNMQVSTAQLPPGAQAGEQVLTSSNGGHGTYVISNNYGANARLIGAVRTWLNGNAVGNILSFVNPAGLGAYNFGLALQRDGAGTYIVNSAGTKLATGPIISTGVWHHIEFDVQHSLTTGVASVYLDGAPTAFMMASNLNTGIATANMMVIGGGIPGSPGTWTQAAEGYWTHAYIMNGTSQVVGAWNFNAALAPQGIGNAKTLYAIPTGPGRITVGWAANGAATVWQSINQIPEDGDTTYASDANPGDAYMCTIGAFPALQTVIAAQIVTFAREDDAGPRSIQTGFGNGAAEGYSGTDQFLGGSYGSTIDVYAKNPITTNPWTVANLTGLQIGAKLTN